MFAALLLSACSCSKKEDVKPVDPPVTGPVAVAKTNTMKIYMHYMPWFIAKPFSANWGSHWKMNTKNPDIVDANGKRQIASYYYPLIGPYDSQDPNVIDYHMLLMKYAGVDGILIDWYGSHNINDYGINLKNTNAIIDRLDESGIQFAVVYEEYTAQNIGGSAITAAQADMKYVQTNYFTNKQRIVLDGAPLLMTFGPRYFKQTAQWDEIFSVFSTKPKFLPLWGASSYVGASATGEFSWVDFNTDYSGLSGFYVNSALRHFDFIIASAFPRYHDFYVAGGTGSSYGYVDANNGDTFKNTLALAAARNQKYLQLVTWNDFGEGTVIEPTQEDQFTFLETLQTFTGVAYGHDELVLIYNYYLKTQQYKDDTAVKAQLKEIFNDLVTLKVADAKTALVKIP